MSADIENIIVIDERKDSVTMSLDPTMQHSAICNALKGIAGVASFDLQVVVKLEQGVLVSDVEDEVVAMLGINDNREVVVHGPIPF